MKRATHYIPSPVEPWELKICDKCCLTIKDVQDGKMFWNPNERAVFVNICRNCFELWDHKRKERANKYREQFAEIKAKETTHGGNNVPLQETNR